MSSGSTWSRFNEKEDCIWDHTLTPIGGHKGFVTLGVTLDERSFRIGRTLGSGDNTQASSGAARIYLIGETAMTQNNIYRISFRGSLVEAENVSAFKALSVTN